MSKNLRNMIDTDYKESMKKQEKVTINTLRYLIAMIKQFEIDNKTQATEENILSIVVKQIKQRNESIIQFKKSDRMDLVEKEQSELNIIKKYLPEQLSDEEVKSLINQAINVTKAKAIRDMGAIMDWLRPKVEGRYNLKSLSVKVRQELL